MIDPESLRTFEASSSGGRSRNTRSTEPGAVRMRYILDVGYRLLFLAAALISVSVMPLWALTLAGVDTGARATGAIGWHAHEMLWGYGGAVLAGFLFTAVRNWTKLSTPAGPWLAVVTLLWLLARVVMAHPAGIYIAGALEAAAWGIVVVGIARPILLAHNARNYPVLGLIALFALCDLFWHLPLDPRLPQLCLSLGLATMTTLLVLVGGRIIPFFTEAALGSQARSYPWIERSIWPLTLVAELAFGLYRTGYVPVALLALFSGSAALAHGMRLWGWWDRRVLGTPLLWVLHAGYAAIVLHFALVPWVDLGAWIYSTALHTLTAGAVGLMTIGMLTRVSLGHGGRPLHVGYKTQTIFGILALAALLRMLAPVLATPWPAIYTDILVAAACLWALAFVGYLGVYGPILLQPGRDPVE